MSKKKMSSFRLRPRFEVMLPLSAKDIETKIEDYLCAQDSCCSGVVHPGYIVFKIHKKDRHYWSPQLNILLDEEEGETLIRARYGPAPKVWAIFNYGYAALGLLATFIAIIGFSQKSLGNPAPILWALPLIIGLAVVLYIMAQTGQKIGAEQTFDIHHHFEMAIGQKVHIH